MAPHHIDDLPRREDDTRQLMLGLIDDLPEERRGTQLMMMLGLGLAVVLFVVLVWVTAPNGPPGTSRPQPSPAMGFASPPNGEKTASPIAALDRLLP